jgi:hypothetical protein
VELSTSAHPRLTRDGFANTPVTSMLYSSELPMDCNDPADLSHREVQSVVHAREAEP